MSQFLITDQEDIRFLDVLNEFRSYDLSSQNHEKIIKAYKLAKKLHQNVKRKSGEPYIIHPIEVAKLAVDYKADVATVCGCLLHDVVEDTPYTLVEIECEFGSSVATIVGDVTKITQMDLNNAGKEEVFASNVRKLFRSLLYHDVRSIAVKLWDRLHNMRTMQFMKPAKQIEKSKQTMDIFVPIAQALGANKIKKELQDLCMYYLHKDTYEDLAGKVAEKTAEYQEVINNTKKELEDKMLAENVESAINVRVKNLYNIFVSLSKGRTLESIHDLYALQVSLNTIKDIYEVFRITHQNFTYLQNYVKDYIYQPKTTGYRALHTTIISQEKMIQAQLRTKEMAQINSKGVLGQLKKYDASSYEQLKKEYPFFSIGSEIDRLNSDDQEFYEKLRYEVLGDKIYVRSLGSEIYELPVGSNILDFAFLAIPNKALYLEKAYVNGEEVTLTSKLKNNDLIILKTAVNSQLNLDWANKCATTRARRLILEQINK